MTSTDSSCIAIIPARGGSKRLPRKNILPLAERPMLSYPIRAALESRLFKHVIVSTEDEEIARVAAQHGAEIHQRKTELAEDRSTVVEVCLDILKNDSRALGVSSFCAIYATAAFIDADDLIQSHALLQPSEVDAVMGVSGYPYHPVQALKQQEGYLRSMWPEFQDVQSQFYPELVVSNGTLYWAKSESFLKEKTFYSERMVGYKVPKGHAIDIDTEEDYVLAQSKMQYALNH